MKILKFLICLFIVNSLISAQSKSNLDIVYELIDSSMARISKGMPIEDVVYNFKFQSLPEYYFVKDQATVLLNSYLPLTSDESKANQTLSYSLNKISVIYGEPEKEGLFGDYNVARSVTLEGSYLLNKLNSLFNSDNFSFSITDTIKYEAISQLESPSLPFTRGIIPSQPFLSSITEPLIAIAAIAITIFLFFTVRSN